MVRYLLDHGASPNETPYNETFLNFAASLGNVDILEETLQPRSQFKHAPTVITADTIYNAITRDVKGSQSVLNMILQRINISDIDQHQRIICGAAQVGSIIIAEELRQWKFDFNTPVHLGDKYEEGVLVTAIHFEHYGFAGHLIQNGCDVNSAHIMTALQASLCHPHYDTDFVESLLKSGANPNLVVRFKTAPITLATYRCEHLTVMRLLGQGANPNPPTSFWKAYHAGSGVIYEVLNKLRGKTALQVGLEVGNLEISELLFNSGASFPSQDNSKSWDPLASAFAGRNHKLVDFVLKKTSIFPDAQKYLPLCVEQGGSVLAHILIEKGVFCLTKDTIHPAVICAAALQDNTKFFEYLFHKVEEILGVIPEEYGVAALVAATRQGNTVLVKTLLETGATPCVPYLDSTKAQHNTLSEKDRALPSQLLNGITAFEALFSNPFLGNKFKNREEVTILTNLLLKACRSSHESNGAHICQRAKENAFQKALDCDLDHTTGLILIKLFVDAGVDINCPRCSKERRSLQIALKDINYFRSRRNRDAKYEYMVQAGVDVNCEATSLDYITPLQAVSKYNDVHLVKLFHKYGANVNDQPGTSYGATALQYAAINGNFEVLNRLLEAGADINASRSEYEGRTAIEGVAENGRLDMVRYLLELGADVRGRANNQYQRAVCRAWKNSHRVLAGIIQDYKMQQYGADDVCSLEEIANTFSGREWEIDYKKSEDKYG